MPTYQYRCTECGADLEAVQKFTDEPLTTCPECGGPLRKVFNAVGVVFKGSGFYATDNRTKGKTNAATASEPATAAATESKSSASSSPAAPAAGSATASGSTTATS